MTLFLAVDAAALVVVAVVWAVWAWRMARHHAREMKMAHALGENVGMKAPELADMFHPKAVYDHHRLMKFTFHIPARLVGELEYLRRGVA